MLIVRDVSEAAAHLASVGIGLEGERFPSLEEGRGVGVHVEFVEEDSPGQQKGHLEVEAAGQILSHNPFVDRRQDGEGRPVPHHLFEFAIVRDVHQL